MLRLLVEYQEAGLSLANHHLGIFAAAHIYNALRQHKMLDRPWPIMDRIIKPCRRALFADAIPTKAEDTVKRFTYIVDLTQKRFFQGEKFKLREPASIQPLRSQLDLAVTSDRALWQIEQRTEELLSEKQDQQSKNLPRVSRAIQYRKRQMTPDKLVGNAQEAVSRGLGCPVDRLHSDHPAVPRTKRRVPADMERGAGGGGHDLRFEPGSTNNDSALLIVCHEALDESRNVREMGIYTYHPGDGDGRGKKGGDDDPDDPEPPRHGPARRRQAPPPSSPDRRDDKSLQGGAVDGNANGPAPSWSSIPLVIHRASTAAELEALLAGTTYAVMDFYTGYDGTHGRMSPRHASLAAAHGVPGVPAFGRANRDDMPDAAARYCKEDENGNGAKESSPATRQKQKQQA
ncbi:hypothetical protein DL762_007429 [Monosporascus cannonballus]|uniref:Uncharacterized protein n=1 Tax=Monosporascus cannonballus TaxID=155416 RepID=A0ABY0H3P4_9PEZI|nr:hypothetical protein DL762_007429 [Monosporascus cannonballus]